MIINVYSNGIVTDITERIETVQVKDWRYYRKEEGIKSVRVLDIHGEKAWIHHLILSGMTEADVSFDAKIDAVRLSDKAVLTIKKYGNTRVHSVGLEGDSVLIIEEGARRPDVIIGTGKVIDHNQKI